MLDNILFQIQTSLIFVLFSIVFGFAYYMNKRLTFAGWSAVAYLFLFFSHIVDNIREITNASFLIWVSASLFWFFSIAILKVICIRAKRKFPTNIIIFILLSSYILFGFSSLFASDISIPLIAVNCTAAVILSVALPMLWQMRKSLADTILFWGISAAVCTFLLRIILLYFTIGLAINQEDPASTYMLIFHLTNVVCSFIIALGFLFAIADDVVNRYKDESTLDPLTTLLNRRGLDAIFAVREQHPNSGLMPRSLILFDIDYFKEVNDRYGHIVGDRVLIRIAKTVSAICHKYGKVGRIGGEEFVVFTEPMEVEFSHKIARQICEAISQIEHPETDKGHSVTASLGCVILDENEHLEKALMRADKNLYKAKAEGRNKIIFN